MEGSTQCKWVYLLLTIPHLVGVVRVKKKVNGRDPDRTPQSEASDQGLQFCK